MIVRDIPGIQDKDLKELGSISAASCSALSKAGHGRVQARSRAPTCLPTAGRAVLCAQ